MCRHIVCLLTCSLFAAGIGTASAGEGDIAAPPEFATVRKQINDKLARNQVPSLAVAVVKNDELVWAEGFGYANLEQKTAATSNTIYRLASISKPLTATGLMILKDRESIDLDTAANHYLPGAKLRSHLGSPDEMTLRRLANHSSGLPIHYNFYYERAPLSVDDAIRCYGVAVTRPGTNWKYSNLGFGILGYITETVSGTPWGQFMEQNVYDPLGMAGTSHRIRPGREADAAVQYNRDFSGRFYPTGHYEFDHPGASVICSTVRDLVRFARMHIHEGQLDGVRILSPQSTREMQVATSQRGDGGSGVGWFVSQVRGQRCISHSGGMPGVSTMLRIYPDQRAVTVVFTNTANGSVVQQITNSLAEILLPESPAAEKNGGPKIDESAPAKSAAPIDWDGTWRGRIAHQLGDIDFTLRVREEDDQKIVDVKFGDRPSQRLQNVKLSPTGVEGYVDHVMLPTQSEFHGPVAVEFHLNGYERRLTGAAVALASGYFALSHWVEAEKIGEAE